MCLTCLSVQVTKKDLRTRTKYVSVFCVLSTLKQVTTAPCQVCPAGLTECAGSPGCCDTLLPRTPPAAPTAAALLLGIAKWDCATELMPRSGPRVVLLPAMACAAPWPRQSSCNESYRLLLVVLLAMMVCCAARILPGCAACMLAALLELLLLKAAKRPLM